MTELTPAQTTHAPMAVTSPVDVSVGLFDLLMLIAGAREDAKDGLGSFEDMLIERLLEDVERLSA